MGTWVWFLYSIHYVNSKIQDLRCHFARNNVKLFTKYFKSSDRIFHTSLQNVANRVIKRNIFFSPETAQGLGLYCLLLPVRIRTTGFEKRPAADLKVRKSTEYWIGDVFDKKQNFSSAFFSIVSWNLKWNRKNSCYFSHHHHSKCAATIPIGINKDSSMQDACHPWTQLNDLALVVVVAQ